MEKSYHPGQTITEIAGANLTSNRRFVKISSGKLVYCGTGDKSLGVLAVESDINTTAPVIINGIVLVEVGTGGVTEMLQVTSDSTGKAKAVEASESANGLSLDTVEAGGVARILLS